MQIIQVPSVFLIKIPGGEWLNLALIRTLEFGPSEEVCITWACGERQIYSGPKAIAILNAWQEAKCIDASGEGELGAIEAQLLAHGASSELIDAVKANNRPAVHNSLLLVGKEQRDRLARIIQRFEQMEQKRNG